MPRSLRLADKGITSRSACRTHYRCPADAREILEDHAGRCARTHGNPPPRWRGMIDGLELGVGR